MGAFPAMQLQVSVPAPGLAQRGPATAVDKDADKQEIDRLRSTNDLWKTYAPEWDLYLAAYEGGGDMLQECHLFKHTRENDEDYLSRVKRAHYLNYCDVLVDFFTNFIFAETIQRDPCPSGSGGTDGLTGEAAVAARAQKVQDNKTRAWYDAFTKNVDMKGSSVDDYMREVSDDFQIYGMSYTLVDAPPNPTDVAVVTMQTQQDHNINPYWCLIHPNEITDWICDGFDTFSYVKRKQLDEKMTPSFTKQKIEKYTEWSLTDIWISEIDVTDATDPKLLGRTTLPNNLGFIPLNVTRYKRSKHYPYMGNSFLRDFAYNNREIMNLTSLVQEFLYRQCFNQLAKETETSIPTASQEDGVLGSANVIEYPRGAKPPSYISPPSEPAKFIQEERTRIQQEMFRRAAQDTLNELFNGEGASGFSQAQSFSKTVPFIASRADILERAEAAIMTMTLKYVKKDWNGKIKYKDRYEITNLTDAITQLVSLGRDLYLPSKTFVVEEMKRLVQEYDGKITPEMLITINDEIDKINFPEWQDVQKQALVGQNKPEGNSPVAKAKSKSKGTSKEAAGKSTQK